MGCFGACFSVPSPLIGATPEPTTRYARGRMAVEMAEIAGIEPWLLRDPFGEIGDFLQMRTLARLNGDLIHG